MGLLVGLKKIVNSLEEVGEETCINKLNPLTQRILFHNHFFSKITENLQKVKKKEFLV
jgi:hypothetical protein